MTLIIGAKCKDGVVIGADQKTMRGMETNYSKKLFKLGEGIVGIAGPTGIRDDFLQIAQARIPSARPRNLLEIKLEIEDIVYRLFKRYGERAEGLEGISALLVGLKYLTQGPAKLYHVLNIGYAEEVDFLCIGHGSPYATSIGKFLYNENYSLEQMARLVVFLISWVSEKLDASVGGTPDVAMIADNSANFDYLSSETIEESMKLVDTTKKAIYGVLDLPSSFEEDDDSEE